ncbi:hypothetical protein CTAYLR_007906 [Chrysophaeum taylorii]|uniref:Uncharacterized protein n=1 Tax=Chrysophaeum taylorii TaxID=2483200 RepID=A0AAD7XPE0_9STRA|nr:hypothetical protein CTAYLR_007906 [Chrysophaeum taylorii]
MIAADRAELESRLKQLTLQIREKEASENRFVPVFAAQVTVFTDNFAVLSTQAAFLCGLGFSGLTMVPSWQRSDEDPSKAYLLVFYTLASISIGFNILTMAISSWCMIFGPGLAIRGPDGSMSRAVAGMYQERKWALRFFWFGILFIMLSSIALGWLKFDAYIAASMTTVFLVFIVAMTYYMTNVTRPRFRFPKDHSRRPKAFFVDGYDPETGKFEGTTATPGTAETASNAGDLNTNARSSRSQSTRFSTAPTLSSRRGQQPTDFNQGDEQREATSKALREINWLLGQGLLTPEEAAAQKAAAIRNHLGDTTSEAASERPSKPSRRPSFFRSSSTTKKPTPAA